MATTSTVPAVKAALVALLTSALPSTQVSYGRPADSMLSRNCVWVGRAAGADRVPVMSAGRKVREQDYSVTVFVWVAKPRGTVEQAEDEAHVLLAEVEDALADDPSLGGVDGLIHATAGSWEAEADVAQEGPFCLVTLDVDVLARLA